jgi:hypothetical protein
MTFEYDLVRMGVYSVSLFDINKNEWFDWSSLREWRRDDCKGDGRIVVMEWSHSRCILFVNDG